MDIKKYLSMKNAPTMSLIEAVGAMQKMGEEIIAKEIEKQKKEIAKDMESELQNAIKDFKQSVKDIEHKAMEKLGTLANDFANKHGSIIQNITSKIQSKTAEDLLRSMPHLKGERGDRGTDGRDGLDGKNGFNGRNGKDGKNGIGGLDGTKGKDGSPDTPKDIVKKLNTIKQSVDISVIKGLTDILKIFKSNIIKSKQSSRGGGMGNWIHQSFACNGVLTSFTLTFGVTAQGKAAIVRYNGQVQDDTTHYSISGTTLSMTFTPDNGSTISIAYVRG